MDKSVLHNRADILVDRLVGFASLGLSHVNDVQVEDAVAVRAVSEPPARYLRIE
jgi:hypothetical protein